MEKSRVDNDKSTREGSGEGDEEEEEEKEMLKTGKAGGLENND